ncbi:MAG TPA: DUF2905 domain-containing protein [Anaerolineales bacterium]
MENLGRLLILGGIVLFLVGGGLFLSARLGLPLGHLPGDIRIAGKNGTFYFPLASSILISFILTILWNIIARWLHK